MASTWGGLVIGGNFGFQIGLDNKKHVYIHLQTDDEMLFTVLSKCACSWQFCYLWWQRGPGVCCLLLLLCCLLLQNILTGLYLKSTECSIKQLKIQIVYGLKFRGGELIIGRFALTVGGRGVFLEGRILKSLRYLEQAFSPLVHPVSSAALGPGGKKNRKQQKILSLESQTPC